MTKGPLGGPLGFDVKDGRKLPVADSDCGGKIEGACVSPNPPKGWRCSSRMGDEWQRGAMVRAGFRVDGSGGGLQQPRGDLVAVCERWQGERASTSTYA